ncbi:MAG: flavin reductase family protein [Bacillota bacterium]|nr:flavin reductase family protein [Bacillota bacterium]
MKKDINVFDYAGDIMKEMQKGALLTSCADGKVNTMAIGWGMIGIQWSKPVFVAMIRESRYTREILDKNGEFTVNVPCGEYDKKILGYCGSKSGRDTDKISDMKLTLEEPVSIGVPGIKELPLTLECRVIYRQKQDPAAVSDEDKKELYPQEHESDDPEANRDYHVYYIAEILNSYIIE